MVLIAPGHSVRVFIAGDRGANQPATHRASPPIHLVGSSSGCDETAWVAGIIQDALREHDLKRTRDPRLSTLRSNARRCLNIGRMATANAVSMSASNRNNNARVPK